MSDLTRDEHTIDTLTASIARAEAFVASRRRKVEALKRVPEEYRAAARREAATFCAPLGALVDPEEATRSGEPGER